MDSSYKKTRLKLGLLYFGIIFFIVVIFSVIVIEIQFRQYDKFEALQMTWEKLEEAGYRIPPNIQMIETIVKEAKEDIVLRTVALGVLILLLSAVLSYYLSGKTLEPILESLEKQKRFVADASHELKTPLTAIKTEGEVLVRSKSATHDEFKDFTKSTIEEVDRLTSLTNNLLELAKLDSKNPSFNFEKVELIDFSKDILGRFEKQAKTKSVKLEFHTGLENCEIQTDKMKLDRLITIIIDNAIKYNKKDGRVDLYLNKEGNKLSLKIKDTGVGINADALDKIFDRFYRVSEDRNEKGFGLGLSIAKGLSEELGIDLRVESEVNEGTGFTLVFR